MLIKAIQIKWRYNYFWNNFIATIGGLGTASFLYHLRTGATTNLDVVESGKWQKYEQSILLGFELLDCYKDVIRTIYFAHANQLVTFASWFSLTTPWTLLYLTLDSVPATFLFGFGL